MSGMKLIICLLTLSLLAEVILCRQKLTEEFDNGYNCCPLEWLPVIESENGRFIPRTAIEAGFGRSRKLYFARSPSVSGSFGAIDDSVYGKLGFFTEGFAVPWESSLVLSNPHGCDISWWIREDISQHPPETSERLFPTRNSNFFARLKYYKDKEKKDLFEEKIGYKEFGRSDFYQIDLEYKKSSKVSNAAALELLYINCTSSLKKHLTSELFDIQYDLDELIRTEKEKTLATTEIINDSDFQQSTEVSLSAQTSSSLKMEHETHLNETTHMSWTIHGSASMNFAIGLFGQISGSVEGENSGDVCMSNFTKTGKVSVSSKQTVFKFKQPVTTKSKSKTKLSIVMTPIEGTLPFAARYRIVPSTAKDAWDNKKIISALQRSGFEDWSIVSEIDGTLVVEYKGKISVEAGVNTRIVIESKPLERPTTSTTSSDRSNYSTEL